MMMMIVMMLMILLMMMLMIMMVLMVTFLFTEFIGFNRTCIVGISIIILDR